MKKSRCVCGVVDIHTHWVPEYLPSYIGARKSVAWPSIVLSDSECQAHVLIEGKVYRTIPTCSWNLSERLESMAISGVTQQVLSPMPELLSYWLSPDDGFNLISFLNDQIAIDIETDPEHFMALGAVPLQDVDLAIRELERVVGELGLPGVEIGSNINGRPIGHRDFLPFFEAAESLGATIFVHALRPAGMDRLVGPPVLEQVLAYPGEIGLAAASLLTSGTFARHPNLRIAFSHGGGSLPALMTGLQHAWQSMPPVAQAIKQSPRELVRKMYFDDLVYDNSAIANLMHCFGETQIMVGSAFPFANMDTNPAERVKGLLIPEKSRELLRHGNAKRWLDGFAGQLAEQPLTAW